MSFSLKVKSELCRIPIQRLCCSRAEAYGILLYCNTFSSSEIKIITENIEFANRLPKLFSRAFNIQFDIIPDDVIGKRIFVIEDPFKIAKIISIFGFDIQQSLAMHVNFGMLEDDCCRYAFLRGAFLSGGSVTDPEKSYHFELATSHHQASKEAQTLLVEMGFPPRSVVRGNNSVIYFKQSVYIEDLLTMIGAPVCAMDIMTAKVDKEIRNDANRALNCDIANVNKTIEAAETQISAIRTLIDKNIIENLPEKLQETANLRINNPDLSLAELTKLHNPQISKSCLNHRLRKLLELSKSQ